MKFKVTFEVEGYVLENFIDAVHAEGTTPDLAAEKLLATYVENVAIHNYDNRVSGAGHVPESFSDYVALTEGLIRNCKKYPIGQFAKMILRGLLERGVAPDYALSEMEKANGQVQVSKFKIQWGLYCNKNFGISFPLLVDEERFKLDKTKFYNTPLNIGGKKFHLCSQWTASHREPMENWIRQYLPKWFEDAKPEQREDMKTFIANA